MPMPAVDLTGQRFGYLTVVERNGSTSGRTRCARWLCQCDCGQQVTRTSQYLRSKHRTHPRSCGCHHGNETHKMSDGRPYRVWTHMRRRCTDPSYPDWGNYGARGITVCPQWLESFEVFWADMQDGYSPHLTLGRIDNEGGYAPENCRWETARQQGNNKRSNVIIDTPKGPMTLAQAARAYNIKPITLQARIRRYGWSVERALHTSTT